MNKTIKYLALAAMAVSANISAHTQQTYLSMRSANVNLPMELTTFNERTQLKLEGRFGGNLQVAGFYGETHNNFGDYFGINGKSSFVLGTAAAPADYALNKVLNVANFADTEKATVSYDPTSKSYGARFDYYQNMDKLLKGLYLKVNTTVVHVENDMELNISDASDATKTGLQTYFKGGVVAGQAKLTNGLMTGEQSETGLADIDVILGYKFMYKNKYHVGINLAITIPTGNDADGVYLFEPIYGNGGHFGFGGGLDAHARLWSKGKQDIKLNFAANYRYLFEASENRTYALTGEKYAYTLITKTTGAVLTPAVNVLTRNSDVTPGSQFDGILAFAYNNGGFSADLGYNLYARETEDVDVKGDIVADLAGYTFNGAAITADKINKDVAEGASQVSNGIYGGLGYHFKTWDYPLLMGVGGKYDWGNKNNTPDSWSVWLKLALSF